MLKLVLVLALGMGLKVHCEISHHTVELRRLIGLFRLHLHLRRRTRNSPRKRRMLARLSMFIQTREIHAEFEEVGEVIVAGNSHEGLPMELVGPRHGRLLVHAGEMEVERADARWINTMGDRLSEPSFRLISHANQR